MPYPVAACRGSKQSEASGAASPVTLPSLALWLRGTPDTLRTAADGTGSAPADTNLIGRWVKPGDSLTSPASVYATEATNKPSLTVAAGAYMVNAANTKLLQLSADVTLTGDFISWYIVKTDRVATYLVCGNVTSSTSSIRVQTNGTVRLARDTGTAVTSTGTLTASTRSLVRIRRVSGTVYIASSAFAEENLGSLTGDVVINRLLAANGFTTNTVADIGEILISTDAATAAAPPAGIDGAAGWFKVGQYGSEPAWNLSI